LCVQRAARRPIQDGTRAMVTSTGAPIPTTPPAPAATTTIPLLLCIAVLVGSWPFVPALHWMVNWWLYSPEYSHGALLPPLVAFLIWRRRDRLRGLPFNGGWLGVVLIAAAAALYLIGELGSLYVVVHVAYWAMLCGIALSLMGWPAFRLILAPLAILLLAIPMPAFFIDSLSTTLQLWSSSIGVAFIRLCGISVFLQGNVIDLGPYKLEVAEACSGVRYLFPLLTLGAVIAYLYKGATWKRLAILLSTIPLTLITNSLRIGLIGVMVDRWGPSLAEGVLHDFQGWAMFMVTGAALIGELAILHRVGGNGGSWRDVFGEPPQRVPGAAVRPVVRRVPLPFVVGSVLVIALGIAGERVPQRTEVVPNRHAFVEFPDQIGSWAGRRSALEEQYLRVLHLDDYLLADYRHSADQPVNLYLAFYNSQRKGSSVHSPRVCLPGSGWELRDFGQHSVAGVSVASRPLVVNRAVVALGNERALVYYWFQERGRVMTNEFAVKWLMVWDALTRRRTDGALVRLTTNLPPGSDAAAADVRLGQFAAAIAPVLPQYIPD
jgi:exosortase D (VPLPA-CTERM-specific)